MMIFEKIGFVLAFIAIGIALDAAFFWRFKNLHGALYKSDRDFTYKDFMFPRLIFVSIACLLVGFGSYEEPPRAVLIVGGAIGFLAFSLYPHLIIYRNSQRIE